MALRGALDEATRARIAGWALESECPDAAVDLLVTIDGLPLARVAADRMRPDLAQAGFGDGRHGFELVPPPFDGRQVAVCRASDGAHLEGSPVLLPPDPARAVSPIAVDEGTTLRGRVDSVTRTHVHGWAQDPTDPETPVVLLITIDDEFVARILCDRPRADLRQFGLGSGRHAFHVDLQGLSPLRRHVVVVRREGDGAHLEGSVTVLAPAQAFDADTRAQVAVLLAEVSAPAEVAESLVFLSAQAERLRRRREEAGVTRAPRALFLDERSPDPGRDAGSNALLSHMSSLRRLGWDVAFAAADMSPDAPGALRDAGIAACHAPWYGSVEEVLRRDAGRFDLVYLHRVMIAARYLRLVQFHQPRARVVFSVADLHHLRLSRQAAAEDRPELATLARQFEVSELQCIAAAHAVITHSSHEADLIRRQVPQARIHHVAWAVPARPTPVPFEDRRGLAFIGHFAHAPNLDAAQWLIDEIMPRVRAANGGIACLLVGSDMPAAVRRTVAAGIEPIGQVPDLADVFGRVRLTVAPVLFGAGIKGKVLESLAAGVPCVCTPLAAEGLDLPPLLQSLTAADPTKFAERILQLHEDAALNRRCREAGLAYVRANLSAARIDAAMREVAGTTRITAPGATA